MKKIIGLIVIALISVHLNAQYFTKKVKGNGTIISETRNSSDYDKIGVGGSFDVELVKGKEGKITIKADENLMEYIVTEVKKGTLKIKAKKNYKLKPTNTIKITVSFENIEGVSLAGSGDIFSKNVIESNNFKVNVAGSGEINLKVDTQTVKSNIAGSGNINLSGNSKDFNCSIAGSGNFNGYDLQTTQASVRIAGSGNVKINAAENLNAKIAGSGNVYYTGSPEVAKSTAGSGSVKKKS